MDSGHSTSATQRVKLRDFAQRQLVLELDFTLAELPRLASMLHAGSDLHGLHVLGSLQGLLQSQPGGEPAEYVRLSVRARLPLTCQRCLQACEHEVDDHVLLHLVDDEPELGIEELESDEEAFCARNPVDPRELVEDQVILALPLVPMHEHCTPPGLAAGALEPEPKASPFAALASLRKSN